MADVGHLGSRLDPRIKGELERLNSTSEEINSLEKELDEARQQFRITLTESSNKLNEAAKRCGKSVKKAKPYHEARIKARKAHEKVQEAAYSYQRAVGTFQAAKETITIAEETSMQGNQKREFDSALQEMLNHATIRLNAAEQEKLQGQKEHGQLSKSYSKKLSKVEQLSKKRRKSIAKSASYYDLRDAFYSRLENLKESVEKRQKMLVKSKKRYREALHNLERISEDIHHTRQLQMAAALTLHERSSGVGAESESETAGASHPEHEPAHLTAAVQRIKAHSVGSRDVNSNLPGIGNVIRSASVGARPPVSSTSSSPDDSEPQSPVLTVHGLPMLSQFDPIAEGGVPEDSNLYRPELDLAKISGIFDSDREVVEATYRGYKSFDAALTTEEVTALRPDPTAPPVIIIDTIEDDSEESEREMEMRGPEEIEMSQFQNEEEEDDGNNIELMIFQQETALNEVSDLGSEGESDDEEFAGESPVDGDLVCRPKEVKEAEEELRDDGGELGDENTRLDEDTGSEFVEKDGEARGKREDGKTEVDQEEEHGVQNGLDPDVKRKSVDDEEVENSGDSKEAELLDQENQKVENGQSVLSPDSSPSQQENNSPQPTDTYECDHLSSLKQELVFEQAVDESPGSRRPRSLSFGHQESIDEDFMVADRLQSPAESVKFTDVEVAQSPDLFDYRAREQPRDIVHEPTEAVATARTFFPTVSSDNAESCD